MFFNVDDPDIIKNDFVQKKKKKFTTILKF